MASIDEYVNKIKRGELSDEDKRILAQQKVKAEILFNVASNVVINLIKTYCTGSYLADKVEKLRYIKDPNHIEGSIIPGDDDKFMDLSLVKELNGEKTNIKLQVKLLMRLGVVPKDYNPKIRIDCDWNPLFEKQIQTIIGRLLVDAKETFMLITASNKKLINDIFRFDPKELELIIDPKNTTLYLNKFPEHKYKISIVWCYLDKHGNRVPNMK